jgi:hypothetical protein
MTLDTQLKQIDPAQDIPDALVHEPAARDLLANLTSQPSPLEPARARPTSRRRVMLAAGATAATVAGVLGVTQTLAPPDAYASWTATARVATPAEQTRWGQDCLDRMWQDQPHDFAVRLVEMRGDFAYTVLTATDGFEATCLMSDPGPGREVTGGGYTGPLTQEPPPDGLVTNSVRAQSDDDGNAQFEVTGKAGSNVTAVTFAVNGTQVHATLHDGYFAAWWPGSTSLIPRFGPPNPDVTITLGDGSQVTRQIQDYDVSPL